MQHYIHRNHVGLIGCDPVFPEGQRELERMAAEFGLFHDDVTTSVDDDLYWMSRLTRWPRAFSGRACKHAKVRTGSIGRRCRASASRKSECTRQAEWHHPFPHFGAIHLAIVARPDFDLVVAPVTIPHVPERDARDRQAPRTTHDGRFDPQPAFMDTRDRSATGAPRYRVTLELAA